MIKNNIQCECGLCCGTLEDWKNHRKTTGGIGHLHWKAVTIGKLTADAEFAIKGLKTFKKTDAGGSP